jgi:hypothetical protein
LAFALFIKITSELLEHEVSGADRTILIGFSKARTPGLTVMAVALTAWGSVTLVVPISTIALWVLLLLKDWMGALQLVAASVGAGILTSPQSFLAFNRSLLSRGHKRRGLLSLQRRSRRNPFFYIEVQIPASTAPPLRSGYFPLTMQNTSCTKHERTAPSRTQITTGHITHIRVGKNRSQILVKIDALRDDGQRALRVARDLPPVAD